MPEEGAKGERLEGPSGSAQQCGITPAPFETSPHMNVGRFLRDTGFHHFFIWIWNYFHRTPSCLKNAATVIFVILSEAKDLDESIA